MILETAKKIQWGIVGCGKIAHKFCQDMALIEDAELTAVASRSLQKAEEFASNYQSKKAYGSYDELFSDPEVEIVYIATPHILHAELSIKAMEHGKHVLCEKPLALNAKDASKMIEVSHRTDMFFMEALWTRFNPNIIEIKQKIDAGEIGEISYINADFSFKAPYGITNRTLALELGGGAILDIGIYPAFLTYLLLGKPKEIMATSLFHPETGCDMQSSMTFVYDHAQAVLYSGFTTNSDMVAKIYGTEGQIFIDKIWHMTQGYSLVKGDKKETFENKTLGLSYSYEIMECHKCLRLGKIQSDLWSHQNSLDLISILDQVRATVGLKYPQES